jgi:hypothetical protein
MLARGDPGEQAVPDVGRVPRQLDPALPPLFVEQADFYGIGDF